jgi:hypothetical protein
MAMERSFLDDRRAEFSMGEQSRPEFSVNILRCMKNMHNLNGVGQFEIEEQVMGKSFYSSISETR